MQHIIRYLSFLCITTLTSGNAFAQNYYEETPKVFDGGLILGINFTQVDGDTYYGYQKVGLTAGGVVYVHFNDVYGATIELLYSQKGSRGQLVTESPTLGTYVEKYYMNLNYVEVPVTLHMKVHSTKFGTFDIEGGGSYARLIKTKEWLEIDQPVVIDPVRNSFNTMDINYVLGVGRKIYKHWNANIRFQYSVLSIRPVERVPYGYSWGDEGQFNNMFTFRLMYLF
jgi:hypothetical protein